MRWKIHRGGGKNPQWIVRPPWMIHGTGTRWRFPTFEAARAAFASGHTYRTPAVSP